MNGLISHIQRCSLSDGPGVRTTVFLMGCPLDCAWCHNPETRPSTPVLLHYGQSCAGCGACAAVCAHGARRRAEDGTMAVDRALCGVCGACADVCPVRAAEVRGVRMGANEVLDIVMRDKPFYDASGGGMTLSGGEPLAQFDFTRALLEGAKERGLHTCLDTSGWGGRAAELVRYVDLFLWDIKHTEPAAHRRWTGVDFAPLLDALRRTDAAGGKTHLRCPVIPGVNDTPKHMNGIAGIASGLKHVQGIDLIAYHPLGVHKAAAMGAVQTERARLDEAAKGFLMNDLTARTTVPARWHR